MTDAPDLAKDVIPYVSEPRYGGPRVGVMMSRRVLITGATGFIAGHFSQRMATEGWEVFGVDRLGAPARQATTRTPYQQIFPAGLGQSMAAVLARTRPDAILHTALDPSPDRYDINVGGTRRWLEEGRDAGVGVQVLLSSLSAAENALAEYGRGKWALEQAFQAAGEVAVRLGVVVGRGGMFARLVASARRTPVIPLLGGGQQLLYVLGVERLSEILPRHRDRRVGGAARGRPAGPVVEPPAASALHPAGGHGCHRARSRAQARHGDAPHPPGPPGSRAARKAAARTPPGQLD